jgi:SAM-dependent methyltransferase
VSERDELARSARRYYEERLAKHGATPAGVDWSSPESQEVRFEQLLAVTGGEPEGTLLDYGCGYGALLGHLRECGDTRPYRGYDLSPAMVERARELWAGDEAASFTDDPAELEPADWVVASGILNVKGDADRDAWERYALDLVRELDRLAVRGFAFNALTIHSDPKHMREDLYYADPSFLVALCRDTLGRQVSLRDDYGLYEFTVVARGDSTRQGAQGTAG